MDFGGIIEGIKLASIGGGLGAIVLWTLKKIPNDQIESAIALLFENLGRVITLGLNKWSFSKKVWNSVVEPWFIDFVDSLLSGISRGFTKGLRSDNES
jgi:hypothetical protein